MRSCTSLNTAASGAVYLNASVTEYDSYANEPLGKAGVLDRVFTALQEEQIIRGRIMA